MLRNWTLKPSRRPISMGTGKPPLASPCCPCAVPALVDPSASEGWGGGGQAADGRVLRLDGTQLVVLPIAETGNNALQIHCAIGNCCGKIDGGLLLCSRHGNVIGARVDR
jgi:hypothetical protein